MMIGVEDDQDKMTIEKQNKKSISRTDEQRWTVSLKLNEAKKSLEQKS